jgi:biopolymer transport protein ExbB
MLNVHFACKWSNRMTSRARQIGLFAIFILSTTNTAHCQIAPEQADTQSSPAAASDDGGLDGSALSIGPDRVLNLLKRGDPSMWGLVFCSIVTVTFALERLIVLRVSRVMPRSFVDRFLDRLRDGEMDRGKAREMCRDNGSPIARLFATAVSHSGQTASDIREAVAEAGRSEMYHLKRRVRALNGIATLAPLLGLFGTVIGMIEAFHALSLQTGGGKTERLANGISLALVATASGLCIAIVAAAAYYYLLGRVDRIAQEMDVLSNEVIDHIAAPRSAEKVATRPRVVPQT